MMAVQLLAKLFMSGRMWLVTTHPVPTLELDVLRAVQFVTWEAGPSVPVFTSREKAEAFFQEVVGDDDPVVLAPFEFNDLATFGAFLNRLAGIGHTHISFDPKVHHAERWPIRAVTDALHRHLFPPATNN